MHPSMRNVASALIALGLVGSVGGAEVRGWRHDGTGVFPNVDPPVSWGPGRNEVWSTELGNGFQASPVLIGDKLLTAVEPDKLICLRASDGKVLWKTSHDLWKDVLSPEETAAAKKLAVEAEVVQKEVGQLDEAIRLASLPTSAQQMTAVYRAMTQEQRDAVVRDATAKKDALVQHPHPGQRWVNLGSRHDGAGTAAATPLSDGRRVYYVFGTGLAIGCDLETGRRLWHNKLEGELGYQHHGTSGASPVLAGDIVVVRLANWLYGLRASDGTQAWEHRDPGKGIATFDTPVVVTVGGTLVVVNLSGQFLRASDGKVLADLDLSNGSEMVPTPVVDRLVILSETGELVVAEAAPDAFRVVSRGPILTPTCWTRPAIAGSRIYARNSGGDLVCVELR